jgi:hypothetical protein
LSKRGIPFLPALLLLAAPAIAQAADEPEAWSTTDSAIRANGAGVTLPMSVAGLSLSKSGEASNGGMGIDNIAQYVSEDGAVQATLYVYRPDQADAAIAGYMTDKAVSERFGTKTRRTAYASAPAAGRQSTAIRAVYDDAADGDLVTTAAFLQSGDWVVKLRVTGPSDQRKAVIAGLDGMLAALRFDDPAALRTLAPATPKDCAAKQTPAATYCLRGTVQAADGSYDLLQRTDVANGAIIVPMDDAGTMLSFDPEASSAAYRLSYHAIGETRRYGSYASLPAPRQIAAIIDGTDLQLAETKSTQGRAADAR